MINYLEEVEARMLTIFLCSSLLSRCTMKSSKLRKGGTLKHDAQENTSQPVSTGLLVSCSPESFSIYFPYSRSTLHQRRWSMKGVGLQVHYLVDMPEEDCIHWGHPCKFCEWLNPADKSRWLWALLTPENHYPYAI